MKNEVTLSPDGTVAYITLTQGQITIVNASDLPALSQHRWYALRNKDGGLYYAATNARDGKGKMRVVFLGRFLTLADSEDRVVYENANPLDNRTENLKRVVKKTKNRDKLPRRSLGMRRANQTGKDGNYAIVDMSKGQVAFVKTDDMFLLAEYRWVPLSTQLAKLLVHRNNTGNRAHTRRNSNNSSGFRGVSFYKRLGKWQAQITVDGRTKALGMYPSPELAYAAYCTAAAWHFGESAFFDPEPPEGSVEEWMIA